MTALFDTESNLNTHANQPKFKAQLAPLVLLTGIFYLNFIARIIPAPLMPTIEKETGVGHGEAGTIFLMISIGYFISLIGAGILSSRLMHRKTIIFSAVAVGIACLGISFSHMMGIIRAGFLVLGLGAGLYLPSGIATLTDLIHTKDWGKAIAVHELAPNLAFVSAPLLSEAFLHWFSWRQILALLGIMSLLGAATVAWFGRGGEFPGESPNFKSLRLLLSEPGFWIMIGLFSLGISATMGIYAMLPVYLVAERGIDQNLANTLVAISRILTLGVVFISGWATDRFGIKPMMAVSLIFTGLMTILLGIVPKEWIVMIVFLQPVLAVCFFPAGFAALSSIGPAGARNTTVSFTVPAAFLLGGGAIPTVIGMMGDAGLFSLAMVLTGGFILTGSISLCWLKLPAR
ncbi:MAG: MFS transporter [Desulfobacterales bacterium]|nr:MFS transporter [Desulfobacterales bacterium]